MMKVVWLQSGGVCGGKTVPGQVPVVVVFPGDDLQVGENGGVSA